MVGIKEFLKGRSKTGLIRQLNPITSRKGSKLLVAGREYTDFSSNDYLGLAGHPALIAAAKKALDDFGVGASASRLLSGDLQIHHLLEERVAKFKNKERALVFNTGYQANTSIISSLYSQNDAIFSDRLNHASIIDGIILSGAKVFRFRHNDAGHLKILLEKERGKFKGALIITESVFSMDGDRPGLKELVRLKKEFSCKMLVDEAHATGIFGRDGSGVVQEEGLTEEVEFIMGTFSKALGGFGAYLAASGETIEYLINVSRGFIYSTALPAAIIAANIAAIEISKVEPFRRNVLLEKARYLRGALKDRGFEIRGESQIVPVIIGDSALALKIASVLRDKDYWVLAIRPPSVPQKESRLRISVTFDHSQEILEKFVDDISSLRV